MRNMISKGGAVIRALSRKTHCQIAKERVIACADHLTEGQTVKLKVPRFDDKGRVKHSMKVLLEGQAAAANAGQAGAAPSVIARHDVKSGASAPFLFSREFA